MVVLDQRWTPKDYDTLNAQRGFPPLRLLARQQEPSNAPTRGSNSYDWRWLLFLIPILLLFIALLTLVWVLLRRRKKQKQRRSVLRNRTLVAADEEKEKEREEKRLSRGNSLSSKLSRMASVKSTTTKSTEARGKRPASSYGHAVDGHARYGSSSTQSHSTGWGCEKDVGDVKQSDEERAGNEMIRIQLVDGGFVRESGAEKDVEEEGEAALAGRVKSTSDTKQLRPTMSSRKELSVIGETGVGEDTGADLKPEVLASSSPAPVTRQNSRQSTSGPASSTGHYTDASTNVFASPTTSSNGHLIESPLTSASDHHAGHGSSSSPSAAAGLGRKLSGVVRLKQPSPGGIRAKSPSIPSLLHRSDSRASRKSSTGRSKDKSLAGQVAPSVTGNWTYTPKAAQWRAVESPSSDAPPTPSIEITEPILAPMPASTPAASTPGEDLRPSPLTRKPSSGVAGSRFVESFDE